MPILHGSSNSSSSPTSPTPPPSPPTTQTCAIITSGTVESLGVNHYLYYIFSAPSSAISTSLTGSYTSNNNVEVGILTSVEYGAFSQNPSTISNGCYYSGNNGGSTINFTPLVGTTYYLVIYDANFITSDTITIVNTVCLTYTTT